MSARRYTRVLLRADHLETPLRDRTPGRPNTSIDFDELGLTEELSAQLEAWNEEFGTTAFDDEKLIAPREREEFTARGAALANSLRRELGEDVEVDYLDGFHGAPAPPEPSRSDTPDEYRWSTHDDDLP